MGIQQLRQAFNDAMGGVGTAQAVLMDYSRHDGVESQIISASGMWSDGTAFSIKSDKLRAGTDLTVAAQDLARRLLTERASSP